MAGADHLVGQRVEDEVVEEEGDQFLSALRLPEDAVVKKLTRTHLDKKNNEQRDQMME